MHTFNSLRRLQFFALTIGVLFAEMTKVTSFAFILKLFYLKDERDLLTLLSNLTILLYLNVASSRLSMILLSRLKWFSTYWATLLKVVKMLEKALKWDWWIICKISKVIFFRKMKQTTKSFQIRFVKMISKRFIKSWTDSFFLMNKRFILKSTFTSTSASL